MAFGEIFSCGTAGSPDMAKKRHLALSGSQSQRRIRFIFPAQGASLINKSVIHGQLFMTSDDFFYFAHGERKYPSQFVCKEKYNDRTCLAGETLLIRL